MSEEKQKRSRGLIFTEEGLQKLQSTIRSAENRDKFGKKYTLEEFSEITGLAYNTVFKVLKLKKGVDKQTLVKFFMAFGLELTAKDYIPLSKDKNKNTVKWINWEDATNVTNFYGRTAELTILKKWILEDCSRLITIYGMAGTGKTTLSVELVKQISNKFDYVLCISLKNKSQPTNIIADLIQFLSDKKESETKLSDILEFSFLKLVKCLRLHRCLIVLDRIETIMQTGIYYGVYKDKYESYMHLIRHIGEITHQSCFLLITRELPREVSILEGESLSIRTMQLNGLQLLEGQKIIQEQNIFGTETQLNALIESYIGNPSALKLVAQTIKSDYNSSISKFLQQESFFCDGIKKLLDWHYERLSILEKKVFKHLAISSEPVSIFKLQVFFHQYLLRKL